MGFLRPGPHLGTARPKTTGSIDAKVIRADGTEKDLGQVSFGSPDALRMWGWMFTLAWRRITGRRVGT